ncbi:hypothetical protein Gorai_000388 [Gossypium raimondii]|uniref:Uncharacterized protein n=1 Tax=Gossypium raimondii TaxID=29730 RepID=A0A7J8PDP2_GOSRA|nr:hypothetical protein [Gossypium raimondii]
MSKEVSNQNNLKKTYEWDKKTNPIEGYVVGYRGMCGQSQGVMEDVSEMLTVVVGCTDGFDSLKDQLREFVLESHKTNMEKVQGALNFSRNKLMERNDALEPMVMALKEETMATMRVLNTRIEELEGELTLYRTFMDSGVSNATLNSKVDVLKPKECAEA